MDTLGFRITFAVLAVYFLLVFAASFALPRIEQPLGGLRFDFVGTGFAALGLFMFLVGISRFSVWGIIDPLPAAPFTVLGVSPALVLAIAGLIVLAIMIFVERRIEGKHGCALLPRSFYETPQVLAGLLACFQIFFAGAITALIVVPYLQRVAGWSALESSLVSVAVGIPMFLLALGIPKLFPRIHPRTILQMGYISAALGFILVLFAISSDGISNLMWLGAILAGAGQGMLSAHCSNVVALAVNDRDASQSGGVQATSRNVGYAICIAALGAVLLFGINSSINAALQNNDSVSQATKDAIAATNIDMMSDENFEALVSDLGAQEDEIDALVQTNADARTSATKTTLGIGAAVMLLSLLSTPFVKIGRKEEE